jgi:hypothetical protein
MLLVLSVSYWLPIGILVAAALAIGSVIGAVPAGRAFGNPADPIAAVGDADC